jgi:hypothetical protein
MNKKQKKALYESIMKQVAITVKNVINEAAEPYSPSSIKEIINVFNNCEINETTVDKQLQEVTVSLINDIDIEYDIDLIYTYTCEFIPGEIPADRDIEPSYDTLNVKVTPKEIVLLNEGDEVDRIPAAAFANIDAVDFSLYEEEASIAVQEEEDIYDWQDDGLDDFDEYYYER